MTDVSFVSLTVSK